MKKINFIFAVLSLMMFVMFSCNSENPVQPDDSQLDTARFSWQVTEMNYFTGGERCTSIWSPDTNEVFMCSSSNYLVHFKDGQLTRINYGTNIQMYFIDGLSATEGYIIGIERLSNKDIPHIEKWNGSSFINVTINYNTNENFNISDNILIKSSNEMWFSAPKGIIYKFDGYNLTKYSLPDTLLYPEGLYNDDNNKLRYLTTYYNSVIDSLQRIYIYEFDGQNWIKVYQDIFPYGNKWYGIFNNFIYAYEFPKTIYKLQNNVLIPIISISNKPGILGLSGNSINNIMGFGQIDYRKGFFHWNGQKWSDEKVGDEGDVDALLQKMINNNYICAIKFSLSSNSYLYRGYRKQ